MAIKKEQALKVIDLKKEQFYKMSDSLWDHPEIGYHEIYATDLYNKALQSEGFKVNSNLAGIKTAFSGTFGSGSPVIGILGEFDALPGMSQEANCTTQKAIISGGAGHGCGHNLLGVGSFAAAVAIKHYLEENNISGTVKFIGCPAEEGGAGKGFMARDGVFDDLDIAFSWHPGEVNSVSSESTMANYQISYHFHGTASHAAMSPEFGRSALDALELMNTGVQYLREHIPQNTRIHYAITDTGGSSPGIVQPYAEVLYLMRAPTLQAVKELYDRVNKVAHGAAMMTETRVEIEFVKACSNTLLNMALLHVLQKNMTQITPERFSKEDYELARAFRATQDKSYSYFETLVADITDPKELLRLEKNRDSDIHDIVMPFPTPRQGFPSSDIGDVSYICPVAQINITTMPSGTTMHSWQEVAVGKSSMAKKGMLYASKIIAASAIDALEDPQIIDRAKQEFHIHTNGKPYQSPFPKNAKPKIPQKEK